jgi:uncharacterized membrane protein HdeD (DUF308 family)
MRRRINSVWPIVAGLVFVVGGINVLFTGVMRAVVLGQERYFVGGLAIVAGIFFIAVAFFPDRSNENNKDGGS